MPGYDITRRSSYDASVFNGGRFGAAGDANPVANRNRAHSAGDIASAEVFRDYDPKSVFGSDPNDSLGSMAQFTRSDAADRHGDIFNKNSSFSYGLNDSVNDDLNGSVNATMLLSGLAPHGKNIDGSENQIKRSNALGYDDPANRAPAVALRAGDPSGEGPVKKLDWKEKVSKWFSEKADAIAAWFNAKSAWLDAKSAWLSAKIGGPAPAASQPAVVIIDGPNGECQTLRDIWLQVEQNPASAEDAAEVLKGLRQSADETMERLERISPALARNYGDGLDMLDDLIQKHVGEPDDGQAPAADDAKNSSDIHDAMVAAFDNLEEIRSFVGQNVNRAPSAGMQIADLKESAEASREQFNQLGSHDNEKPGDKYVRELNELDKHIQQLQQRSDRIDDDAEIDDERWLDPSPRNQDDYYRQLGLEPIPLKGATSPDAPGRNVGVPNYRVAAGGITGADGMSDEEFAKWLATQQNDLANMDDKDLVSVMGDDPVNEMDNGLDNGNHNPLIDPRELNDETNNELINAMNEDLVDETDLDIDDPNR
jgi:hypothetical protein